MRSANSMTLVEAERIRAFLAASLKTWDVLATVSSERHNVWKIRVEDGGPIRVAKATKEEYPARWRIEYEFPPPQSTRFRGTEACRSIVSLLRALRNAVGAEACPRIDVGQMPKKQ